MGSRERKGGGRKCGRGVFTFVEDFEPGVELSAVGWGDVEFAVPEAGEDGVGSGDAVGEAGYVLDHMGLIKLDEKTGNSRKYARYLPFWA